MAENIKHKLQCVLLLGFSVCMGMGLLLRAPDEYSAGERRTLAKKPALNAEQVSSGKYMQDFETFALDQLPGRELFRSIKAYAEYDVFWKLDNHGIYLADGYLSKQEYPMNEELLEQSCKNMTMLYEKYLQPQGISPYLVMIPDKNYYLAQTSPVLAMDYEQLFQYIVKGLPFMTQIEVCDLLELSDYYFTDTHWRQEKVKAVADRIAGRMGSRLMDAYEIQTLETPFYGVYAGQSALVVEPDTIQYVVSETLNKCTVTAYDNGYPIKKGIYDAQKAQGKDAYDFFLSGASPILEIDNPDASTDRELVIFRDSFASSLTPYLVEAYRKVTLVDIRYVQMDYIDAFVEFHQQDVLFMYSTLLLNQGLGRIQ